MAKQKRIEKNRIKWKSSQMCLVYLDRMSVVRSFFYILSYDTDRRIHAHSTRTYFIILIYIQSYISTSVDRENVHLLPFFLPLPAAAGFICIWKMTLHGRVCRDDRVEARAGEGKEGNVQTESKSKRNGSHQLIENIFMLLNAPV